jgi:hypothetical protein
MRAFKTGGRVAVGACCLVIASLSLPLTAQAVKAPPHPVTGGVRHVLSSSALLTATVPPNTTYYFQYGPSPAYGSQTATATATVSAGSALTKVPVGQAVSGLLAGATYHYRVVALAAPNPPSFGRDRFFSTKGNRLKFVISKPAADVFGSPIILSGNLTGSGSTGHRIVLQSSPFPYLEPFTNLGIPGVTDGSGRFSFRIANLATSTQFRVITMDPLPVISPVVTVGVAVRVSFSVRSSSQTGLVRLYGTVTPAVKGAEVIFQVQKAVRPGKNEATNKYINQLKTVTKHGGRTFSRFSLVAKIRKSGRYRAFIRLKNGGSLVSGASSRTIVIHAAPGTTTGGKRKK